MVAVLIGVLGVIAFVVDWYLPGDASAAFLWACLVVATIAVYITAVLWWGRFPAEHNDISRKSTLPPDYTPNTGLPLWQNTASTRTVSFR
ncbi:hypothetical protein IQ24_00937 [Paracoccus sulfuroxidans]|uniref:Uncharacterized protein n=1 Tax=Paracoccus sulfuroxidans TaxID=384678 RepID=A0A562NYA6_9RHOB|nr:hypothetical protein IQ24_00937 [Paracoccus sulfuroxidans]